MLTCFVPHVDTPDWSVLPALPLSETGWLPAGPVSAFAQICHDGTCIHVRMEARESDIRATLTDPLDQVCEDSCLEFFFAPLASDDRYFNFEFNPLGNFYLGFGRTRETRCRLLPADAAPFCIRPYRTETGWGVTFRIPFSFLRMYMPDFSVPGASACNFYKCGEQTKIPHYLSWASMTSGTPDFHRRGDFGAVRFE